MSSQAVKETISLTATYYGRELSDQVLLAYAADLADLPPHKVCEAYVRWRRNPENKTFPLPAHIRELVAPEEFISAEVKARETASRIIGAITKFGWCNGKEAQLFIGPEGWALVLRMGGWRQLCETANVKVSTTTLHAQMRDELVGVFKHGLRAIERSLQIVQKDEHAQLEPAKAIIKKITDEQGGEGA